MRRRILLNTRLWDKIAFICKIIMFAIVGFAIGWFITWILTPSEYPFANSENPVYALKLHKGDHLILNVVVPNESSMDQSGILEDARYDYICIIQEPAENLPICFNKDYIISVRKQ